jgi:preprotein translocase SecE subunit
MELTDFRLRNLTLVMFLTGGIVLGYILYESGIWAWDFLSTTDLAGDLVGKPHATAIFLSSFLIAGVATWAAARNEQLFELAGEVISELRKVTWPTRQETFAATIVVIVTVIVSSLFLGLFDLIWSWVSRLIYG